MVTTRRSSNGAVSPASPAIKRVPLFRVSTEECLTSPIERRSLYYRQQARELVQNRHEPPARQRQAIFTLPTILTLLRVALVPVLMACWYGAHRHAPVATAVVFITASVTDWLDGYLARRMALASGKQSTFEAACEAAPSPPYSPPLCSRPCSFRRIPGPCG